MTPAAVEANFDGIVGPTHNYAGLAYGNLASMGSGGSPSNPRKAALQGLAKMKLLADLGLVQGVLPPQERPDVGALRDLGFCGSDDRVLASAARRAPGVLVACASASSMWAANAATVSPSADTTDGRVHFTPANLCTQPHRALETRTTARILRTVFAAPEHFVHHDPLPPGFGFADEGSANAMRLGPDHGSPGVEVLVYGRSAAATWKTAPRRYPARQTREASEAIARRHRLRQGRVVLAQQSSAAIEGGVFHNDVIAVANGNVLFYHEQAFAERAVLRELRRKVEACGVAPVLIEVPAAEISLAEAVRTYLFNGQLVTCPDDGRMVFVAPSDCRGSARARNVLGALLESENPVAAVQYVNVRQSMKNGGGPACLRLRVVLTAAELDATHRGVLLDGKLYRRLRSWVERHYRDRLAPGDLADPALLEESRAALDELTGILGLGSLYAFQGVDGSPGGR
jgi:succinylarginine dihydrolase